MDPRRAVLLHGYLEQPTTIPIHWGVFERGDESLDELPEVLSVEMKAAGMDENCFHA